MKVFLAHLTVFVGVGIYQFVSGYDAMTSAFFGGIATAFVYGLIYIPVDRIRRLMARGKAEQEGAAAYDAQVQERREVAGYDPHRDGIKNPIAASRRHE
ncbi:MAG: hypothetical protein RLO52_27830 [Sandaracinaceae bacterium]